MVFVANPLGSRSGLYYARIDFFACDLREYGESGSSKALLRMQMLTRHSREFCVLNCVKLVIVRKK